MRCAEKKSKSCAMIKNIIILNNYKVILPENNHIRSLVEPYMVKSEKIRNMVLPSGQKTELAHFRSEGIRMQFQNFRRASGTADFSAGGLSG